MCIALVMRFLMLQLMKLLYDPGVYSKHDWVYFNIFGDNFEQLSNLGMTLKKFISLYWLHGMMYLPITILVFSILFIFGVSLHFSLKRKTITIALSALLLFILPPCMAVVEGNVTKYRSAQYILPLSSFAVFLAAVMILRLTRKKLIGFIGLIVLFISVFNQCSDSNKYFYLDYEKYLDARETSAQIYNDLVRNYDLSKPVVFVGAYKVPDYIREESCVSFGSLPFRIICLLTDPIDVHWKEKFYIPEGYCYLESLTVSVLIWGTDAFDHTSTQMINFLRMNGHSGISCVTDPEIINEARRMVSAGEMPSLFKPGYIFEADDYIVINIEN